MFYNYQGKSQERPLFLSPREAPIVRDTIQPCHFRNGRLARAAIRMWADAIDIEAFFAGSEASVRSPGRDDWKSMT
jgi:hypothetical protein